MKKGIINDVEADDGKDIAKVIGGNVVLKLRRVEAIVGEGPLFRGAKLWEHGSGAPEMQFCDLVFWDAF